MASDKSGNTSNSLPLNVKIKVEPGTSMPVPIKNIKTEPGLSSTTRLTSFRLPRDLTLGGNIKTEKPKKVYTPNLNVQRTKKKEDAVQNDAPKSSRSKDYIKGRGRGNTDRGSDRGRGRGSNNLIQSSGIWSTGITSTAGKRYSSGSRDSDRSSQVYLEKPKLDLNRSFNKAEEEEKIKLLLRDDFIDDGESINLSNAPVVLPMIKEVKPCKQEIKIKKEVIEEEIDRKPIILENGEVLSPKKESKCKISKSDKDIKDEFLDSIPKIINNKIHSYILMQFPDCLPGLVSSAEDTKPNRSNYEKEDENKSETEFCTLNSLKPGILGKLQILKSGKARLLLGENNLIVDVGSHLSFRQDLIATKVDTENLNGDLINLGPVNSTLICSPDWESMLAKL
ncbi:DNA-directed RNA polymerase III subunit RPC4 [Apis mellifera]|uniref:DNA-directed RNA polymerase III subunit RPC4 n=1 Tax=Apis mellifera TaxID=7460 RepID=A0A7M7GYD7_APIME|nr:DNA-directed RNA polymerase III subunit RPC4 [Apis mellifera]|eukprot:XP_006566065.1 DNA-directed RNA polymerase III subunit RPC4 [Apis mellifera]